MIIKFSESLNREDIFANGDELVHILGRDIENGEKIYHRGESENEFVASFRNPVLVKDHYRIGRQEPVKRDTLFDLFERNNRQLEYDSVTLNFNQKEYLSVWGPSIDTLLMCRAISKVRDDVAHAKNCAEIGSASGFLAKYLAEKIDSEIVYAVDINSQAKKFVDENINNSKMHAVIGDGLEFLAGRKLDLVVCNPPYIPRPVGVEDNAFQGMKLLKGLINHANDYLNDNGSLILNISNLCEDDAYSLMKKNGLEISVIDKMRVPLKVSSVLNNKEWLAYLSNVMEKKLHKGYYYWQTLSIYKISKK